MKIHRRPKDENRDHRNFLQHLAGNRQISFDTFDVDDGLGKFDSAVESDTRNYLSIRKPKGRIPFNANLLTAGQVKFSNLQMSGKVRDKLRKRSDVGSVNVYDAVYGMLENKRCANKASSHFQRPKILNEHLKEVGENINYGYETSLYGKRDNDGTSKEYKVKWEELRGYLYGFKQESDITDPVIENIVKEHKKVLDIASSSLNPTTSIVAALEVASSFYVTYERGPGGYLEPNTEESTEAESGEEIINVTESSSTTGKGSKPTGKEIAKKVQEDIIDSMTNPENFSEYNANERVKAGLEPLPTNISFDDLVNDNVNNQEALQQVKFNRADNCGAVVAEGFKTIDFQSSVDASNVILDSAYDSNSSAIGTSGHRPTRNSWRLPILGDAKVFRRNPITSADLITLVDISGSMGTLQRNQKHSWTNPVTEAANVITAIKKRFPDSKAYGFTEPYDAAQGKADEYAEQIDKENSSQHKHIGIGFERHYNQWAWKFKKDYDKYEEKVFGRDELLKQGKTPLPVAKIEQLEHMDYLTSLSHVNHSCGTLNCPETKVNAGLYPIESGRFPDLPGGSTPLCGAMKGIEELFQLHNARVLIITDGDGNNCYSGNANDCIRTRADIWRNRGVRFGTLLMTRSSQIGYPLPTDLSIEMFKGSRVTSSHINRVFNFLKG